MGYKTRSSVRDASTVDVHSLVEIFIDIDF